MGVGGRVQVGVWSLGGWVQVLGRALGVALVIFTRVATPEASRWQHWTLRRLLREGAARRAFRTKLAVGVPKEECLAALDGGWLAARLPTMRSWSRPRGPGIQNELRNMPKQPRTRKQRDNR